MPDVVSFDAFEVDLLSHELLKKGVPVPLQEQPFRILEILIRAEGRLISREQLTSALWPSGTFVDFDRGLNTAVNKLRAALGDSAEDPKYIETLGRRGYRFIGTRSSSPMRLAMIAGAALLLIAAVALLLYSRRPQPRAPIHSIAVLPLANLSRDPEQAFFADGMTDELITDLAKIHGLDVISHQSVMQFKSSPVPLPEIARQLGVDAIVEGSVVRHGTRVRVTAQLIDARSDRHLWANDYEREVGDVLALQDEVARDIVEQIGTNLAYAPARPASRSNTEAYLLYLRGRYEWNKLPPNFDPAIAFFEKAIKEDPGFARAYAGLADCYATRRFWNAHHEPDDADHARSLASRSLELDPSLSEAYATLGGLDDDRHDYVAAEADFRRAIATNSNYIIGHQWYAVHLLRLGRTGEALREARIAYQLDPLSWYANVTLASTLEVSGKTTDAIERTRAIVRLFPEDGSAHFTLFMLLHSLRRDDEALPELVHDLSDLKLPALATRIETSYRTVGFDGVTRMVLTDPQFLKERDHWRNASLHALLREGEATLDHLESAYASGEAWTEFINVSREFDFVRADPRFQNLLRQMNLNATR